MSIHSALFHKKYKHVFDIQTRDRTYFLVASSQEEMVLWVKSLCSVCSFITQERKYEIKQQVVKTNYKDANKTTCVNTI